MHERHNVLRESTKDTMFGTNVSKVHTYEIVTRKHDIVKECTRFRREHECTNYVR